MTSRDTAGAGSVGVPLTAANNAHSKTTPTASVRIAKAVVTDPHNAYSRGSPSHHPPDIQSPMHSHTHYTCLLGAASVYVTTPDTKR